MKVLIIGGVAGGMSAAARLRRNSETAEITVIERGAYISFANCGLPYYIGGEIKDREKLLVQTPQSFSSRYRVRIMTEHEAVEIKRDVKEVMIKDIGSGRMFVEKYDKLLLSPGAEPLVPPIPGIKNKNIFTLRSMADSDRIFENIRDTQPRKAVIIGGGYIGLEMAENLKRRGIFVSIVEALPQVMNVIDPDIAALVHSHLWMKNIELYLNDGVASFSVNAGGIGCTLKSGREINADFVILSIGVTPETGLAKACGLVLGDRGIRVNEYMQTSDVDIYAVGDAVEVINPVLGKSQVIPLAGPANKQGRIAADNIVNGTTVAYGGSIGTGVLKIFDMTAGGTGLNEKQLKKEKVKFDTVIIHGNNHAGYYPGATQISVKLHFAPDTGRILGFQAAGFEGVEKRIDVAAILIQKSGTIHDLAGFEHCYAPPYSSAKDPLNMAGFTAENIIKGKMRQINADTLHKGPDRYQIIDVREKEELNAGMIYGALHIPLNELRSRINEVLHVKPVCVYCAVGLRGYIASRILSQSGYSDVYNLSGGYVSYAALFGKAGHGAEIGSESFNMGLNSTKKSDVTAFSPAAIITVDACGLQCPGPILRLKKEIDALRSGDRLSISASDQGFYNDVGAWARATGNTVLSLESNKGIITAVIEKNKGSGPDSGTSLKNTALYDKTMVIFSGDLDKVIAAFIIANGALAMGRHVTLFFTFWGLNALKKGKSPSGLKKTLIERAFGLMLPRGSKKLALSQMQMAGIGSRLIRAIMKKHSVSSLEELLQSAISGGVKIVACKMTMDLMGIKREELIDGVEIGGVASFLESSEKSGATLFI